VVPVVSFFFSGLLRAAALVGSGPRGAVPSLQVLPTTEWRYALVINWSNPEASFEFFNPGLSADLVPFNHTNWGSYLVAQARVIPQWRTVLNSADNPPASPVCEGASPPPLAPPAALRPRCATLKIFSSPVDPSAGCGEVTRVLLVPYGGTDLRISEMPWA
jgi:hypothetical protein